MCPVVPSGCEPGNILGMEVEVLPPTVVEVQQFPSGCDHAHVKDEGHDNGRLTRLQQRRLWMANREEGRRDYYSEQRHAQKNPSDKADEDEDKDDAFL